MKKTILSMCCACLLVACGDRAPATNHDASSATVAVASADSTGSLNNALRSSDVRKEALGGDFTLTDGAGKPFTLSSLKGKAVILAFGFTNCPEVCPTELLVYKEAVAQLGEAGKDVAVVFVSVDPERDTPELMGRYVAQFSPDFIGLTDTVGGRDIALVKQLYRIVAEKVAVESSNAYNVDHTAGAYLLDKAGNVAYFAPYGIESPQLAEDLKAVLAQ